MNKKSERSVEFEMAGGSGGRGRERLASDVIYDSGGKISEDYKDDDTYDEEDFFND